VVDTQYTTPTTIPHHHSSHASSQQQQQQRQQQRQQQQASSFAQKSSDQLSPQLTQKPLVVTEAKISGKSIKLFSYQKASSFDYNINNNAAPETIVALIQNSETFVSLSITYRKHTEKKNHASVVLHRILESFRFFTPSDVSIPYITPVLTYEHIGHHFGFSYLPSQWIFLSQVPNQILGTSNSVVFLRKSREETSRMVVARESLDSLTTGEKVSPDDDDSISPILENIILKRVCNEAKLRNATQFRVLERSDVTVAYTPSRKIHTVSYYPHTAIRSHIIFLVVSSAASSSGQLASASTLHAQHVYTIHFTCLEQDLELDWPDLFATIVDNFYLF